MLRWHRSGFRLYWRWKSRSRGGRPKVPIEVRSLIRRMSVENPLWGAPRIHGELLKLGIEVAQSTVAKYMAKRRPGGSGQTWKTFLRNHVAGIGAMDFLVVPTINFRLLFVLVILRHERRRLISLSVTDHPTAEWIARQITEAFPWDSAPTDLIRDRDASLRPCRQAASCGDGHPGSPDCAALTLAEWPCGEADWLDPSRMPGSRRDLWRSPPAPSPQGLCRLLQQCPAASILWPRMRRLFVLSSGSVTSPRRRSSADFIINTAERSCPQESQSRADDVFGKDKAPGQIWEFFRCARPCES